MKQIDKLKKQLSTAHILLAVAVSLFFILLPGFVFKNFDIDRLLALLMILNLFFLILSLVNKQSVLSIFNSVFLFLMLYPYYLQQKIGFKFSIMGDVNDLLDGYTFSAVMLYILAVNIFSKDRQIRKNNRHMRYNQNSSNITSFLISEKFWIFSFITFVLLYIVYFGLGVIFYSRTEYQIDSEFAESGYIRFLMGTLKIFPFWIANRMFSSRIVKGKRAFGLLVGFVFLGAIVICNPGNTARFLSLAGILVALFPVILRLNLLSFVPAVLPVIIVLLPITSAMRHGLFGDTEKTKEILNRSLLDSLKTLEFSSMQILNDAFVYSSDLTGWFGKRTISAILILIPRSIWPDKNTGTGFEVASAADYIYTGVGVSPIFDIYLDFGFVGIVVFGAFTGLALLKLEILLYRAYVTPIFISPFLAGYVGMLPIFLRGDTGTFMISLYSFVFSYWMLLAFVWGRKFVSPIRLKTAKPREPNHKNHSKSMNIPFQNTR